MKNVCYKGSKDLILMPRSYALKDTIWIIMSLLINQLMLITMILLATLKSITIRNSINKKIAS